MTSYNIILNSLNQVAGGTNASCSYNFDWGIIPSGKYTVNFSYIGGANSFSASRVAILSCDLGQNNTFTTSSSSTSSRGSRVIGYLEPLFIASTGNAGCLFAEHSINPPVYLANIPNSNTFLVQVSNADGTPFTDSLAAVNAGYILTLHFELIV